MRSPTIFSGDISSGVDLLQRRSPPVTSPPASSPYQPLCLLHQNLSLLRLFARIHREWRNRFRHLRSKINSNLCSAALPPLTFLYFSAWCLCCCPSLFQRVSKNRMKDSVNYQIISPKDLAKSVLSSIIEFTREDVEALLNEKAKRKDRFSYKIKGVIKVGEATGSLSAQHLDFKGNSSDLLAVQLNIFFLMQKTVSKLMAQLNEKSFELEKVQTPDRVQMNASTEQVFSGT
ncbi:hypothetical protein Ahy_B09g097904 isoform B [Arachis hypogaea]|uniref:Uncharacterized protein n=2 Tax=Arachis hypogaea TaxID=3818 RepID=A0A444XQP2_ARAHY|nr:hypothetical protein Ahy_B09g097904 isoform B [Arachis hypogaea]